MTSKEETKQRVLRLGGFILSILFPVIIGSMVLSVDGDGQWQWHPYTSVVLFLVSPLSFLMGAAWAFDLETPYFWLRLIGTFALFSLVSYMDTTAYLLGTVVWSLGFGYTILAAFTWTPPKKTPSQNDEQP